MPRERKTDHQTVIDTAQDQFWRQGYSGTSTRMIEENIGLTRFTLQTSYGGKDAFILETLDAYLERAESQFFPDPDNDDAESLAVWFESLSCPETMPLVGDRGCLLHSAINEYDRGNSAIDSRINRYFACLQSRFTEILQKARARGEISSKLNPEEKSRLLISLLLGISMAIKARTDNDSISSYTTAAANLIRDWKT